jgi:NitT/TauT family transport system permease protein
MATTARRLLFYLGLLAVWEAVFRLQFWPEFLFPSPFQVLQALGDGFAEQRYVSGVAASLRRILIGYGISVMIGTLLGLVQARWKIVDETLGSLVLGLQTLPSICWLPLALLWFGLDEKAIIFVVIMGSLLSITIATEHGVKHTPPLLIRAARTMGARGVKLYVDVILPAALPSVIEGMKQGWSFAWRSLMAGELLFVSMGLGQLLSMGRELNDMSQVVAVMLVIVAIGLFVDRLVFARLGNAVRRRWGLQTA